MGLRNVVAVFGVGLAACALLGCTGQSSFDLPPIDAGAPDARYEEPCAAWARTRCAYEGRCEAGISGRWENTAQCVSRDTIECELVAQDPAVRFDPVAVAGCVYPTDCSSGTPGLCLPPGKSRDGAACQWNDGCASGVCSLVFIDLEPAPCGTCVTLQACPASCAADQVCRSEADGGAQCVTLPTAGEACTPPDYECANASCQVADFGANGLCAPLSAVGQPCGPDPAGPVCADPRLDSFCDETSHCRAFLAANYGQTCGEADGGDSYLCAAYGTCDSSGTSRCVPPAGDGALCDDEQGLSCLPPARCQNNRCAFPVSSWCTLPE